MSDFDNLDGIGGKVDREQVEESLDMLRRCVSLMETDREELITVIRVLEVLYDAEPDRPTTDEARKAVEVIENVSSEDVVSLEPEHVDEVLTEGLIQLRLAQKLEPKED